MLRADTPLLWVLRDVLGAHIAAPAATDAAPRRTSQRYLAPPGFPQAAHSSQDGPAYTSIARGANRPNAAAACGAQHPRARGAGCGRPGRDLFHRQAGNGFPGGRCTRFPGRDADADDVGRRHGRRHLVRHRTRARRFPPRRRQCIGIARRHYRPRVRAHLHARRPWRWPLALWCDGRRGSIHGRRFDLLQLGFRRRSADMALQLAGGRDPRHGQHGGAGHRDLGRHSDPDSAIARADLRLGAIPGVRDRRRRHRIACLLRRGDHRAYGRIYGPAKASCTRPFGA